MAKNQLTGRCEYTKSFSIYLFVFELNRAFVDFSHMHTKSDGAEYSEINTRLFCDHSLIVAQNFSWLKSLKCSDLKLLSGSELSTVGTALLNVNDTTQMFFNDTSTLEFASGTSLTMDGTSGIVINGSANLDVEGELNYLDNVSARQIKTFYDTGQDELVIGQEASGQGTQYVTIKDGNDKYHKVEISIEPPAKYIKV